MTVTATRFDAALQAKTTAFVDDIGDVEDIIVVAMALITLAGTRGPETPRVICDAIFKALPDDETFHAAMRGE